MNCKVLPQTSDLYGLRSATDSRHPCAGHVTSLSLNFLIFTMRMAIPTPTKCLEGISQTKCVKPLLLMEVLLGQQQLLL